MSRAINVFIVCLFGITAMIQTEAHGPHLRLQPELTVYIVGENLSLRCVADSPLSITGYSFFKDSTLIAANSTSDRLIISSLSITDAGNYFCTYYNQEDVNRKPESNHIDLKVFERPSAPTLSVQPQRNVFVVNQSAVISCILPRATNAVEVNLYKNGAVIYGSDNFGVLTLANTEKRNTGNYTCQYKIAIAGRTVDSHPSNQATLVVIDLPPTPILRHAHSLQYKSREVEIICEIPNPSSSIHGYYLYRNGGEVSSSQANRFVKNYTLEFDGSYFCRSFVNILGEEILSRKSDEIFLTSEEAHGLHLRLQPELTVYIVGENLSLRCVADSPLSITGYSFFKDSTLIAANSTSDRLIISSLSITDAGNYFCTYYNQEDVNRKPESNHIDLKVFERPSAPTLSVQPQRNVFVVNQSAVISCILPRATNVLEVNLYKNGAVIYGSDNFGVLTLANTEKRNTGNYTCQYKIAIAGRTVDSHPSNQATLVVIDLPPTPVLRHAHSLQNKSREVEIICEIPKPSSFVHGYYLYRNGGEVSNSKANRFVKNYSLEFDGCYFCRSFVNMLGEEILSRKSDEVFLTSEESQIRSCQTQNSERANGLSTKGAKLYGSVLIGKVIVLISILLIFGIYLLVIRQRSKKSASEEQSFYRL